MILVALCTNNLRWKFPNYIMKCWEDLQIIQVMDDHDLVLKPVVTCRFHIRYPIEN